MEENKITFRSVDEYITQFPFDVQEILKTLRGVIKESAPDAKEKISYQMPTFELHGNLVHFAAFKKHIGLYPAPSGIDAFKLELSEYKGAKGSVQFPIDKPLPYELISKIVKFRVAENMEQAEGRLRKKKSAVLVEKLTIKHFKLSNRYVCAPFDISKATEDGLVTDELLSIYAQRKGPSMIVVEQACVMIAGQWRAKQLFVDRDACIESLAKLAEVIHSNGQVAVLQINHAGSMADTSITNREAVAPSAVINPGFKRTLPRELSLLEIEEIKASFVEAAIRTIKAGFDGVEIHSCHGFLLTQFLSPLCNLRTDQYGGSLENRSRLLLEITTEVREAIGDHALLLVRLGADDYLEGGFTLEEGCAVAKKLEQAGVDILDVSSGLKGALAFSGPGFFSDMLRKVKSHVGIPVIGTGELENIAVATQMVTDGVVDLVSLGRPIMKKPDYVQDLLIEITARMKA